MNLVLVIKNGCSRCLTLRIDSIIRGIYLEIVWNGFSQTWAILILAKLQIDWIIYMVMKESRLSFRRMKCLLLSFFNHFHKVSAASFQRFPRCYRIAVVERKIRLFLNCRYTLRELAPVFIRVILLYSIYEVWVFSLVLMTVVCLQVF